MRNRRYAFSAGDERGRRARRTGSLSWRHSSPQRRRSCRRFLEDQVHPDVASTKRETRKCRLLRMHATNRLKNEITLRTTLVSRAGCRDRLLMGDCAFSAPMAALRTEALVRISSQMGPSFKKTIWYFFSPVPLILQLRTTTTPLIR